MYSGRSGSVRFRRGIYSFLTVLTLALGASASGVSLGRDEGAHTITVSQKMKNRIATRKLHCGMVASYMPQVLKDYRLVRIGDEFLDVKGKMLFSRGGEEAIAARHWVESTKMSLSVNEHYYEASFYLPKEKGVVVLHPEVCDEFADNQRLTERRACEYVFLVRACGLLGQLDDLSAQIQDGIARTPAAANF